MTHHDAIRWEQRRRHFQCVFVHMMKQTKINPQIEGVKRKIKKFKNLFIELRYNINDTKRTTTKCQIHGLHTQFAVHSVSVRKRRRRRTTTTRQAGNKVSARNKWGIMPNLSCVSHPTPVLSKKTSWSTSKAKQTTRKTLMPGYPGLTRVHIPEPW